VSPLAPQATEHPQQAEATSALVTAAPERVETSPIATPEHAAPMQAVRSTEATPADAFDVGEPRRYERPEHVAPPAAVAPAEARAAPPVHADESVAFDARSTAVANDATAAASARDPSPAFEAVGVTSLALPPDSDLVLVETRFAAPAPEDAEPQAPRARRMRPPRAASAEEPLQMVETRKQDGA
jgi:hypothetical protein